MTRKTRFLILFIFYTSVAVLYLGCAGARHTDGNVRTPENFMKAIVDLVKHGDLANEGYISKAFLIDLGKTGREESRSLITGEILGVKQSFSVSSISDEVLPNSRNENPYFSIFSPIDKNFQRAIYVEELNQDKLCISQSRISAALGPGRVSSSPHAPTIDLVYEFERENAIALNFQFDAHDAACASEISLFQNRNK
jgi:hypothetical protein